MISYYSIKSRFNSTMTAVFFSCFVFFLHNFLRSSFVCVFFFVVFAGLGSSGYDKAPTFDKRKHRQHFQGASIYLSTYLV